MDPHEKLKVIIDRAIISTKNTFSYRPYILQEGKEVNHINWSDMRDYALTQGYEIRITKTKEGKPPLHMCEIKLEGSDWARKLGLKI
jgi:hypothetical protein